MEVCLHLGCNLHSLILLICHPVSLHSELVFLIHSFPFIFLQSPSGPHSAMYQHSFSGFCQKHSDLGPNLGLTFSNTFQVFFFFRQSTLQTAPGLLLFSFIFFFNSHSLLRAGWEL